MNSLEFLGKKWAIDILLEVYRTPGIVQKNLADKQDKGSSAKQDRISEAIELGLIRSEKSTAHWSAITYYITSEGERICRHLLQIENGSSEEKDPSKLENTEQLTEKAQSD